MEVHHRGVQDQASGVSGGCLLAVACVAVIAGAGAAADAANALRTPSAWEGGRANSILLNGTWEFCVGDGSERAESPEGAHRLPWKTVTLPGPFMPYSQEAANETKVVWTRRRLEITPAQARGLAVLRWNGLPGTVAIGSLEGPALAGAEKILWVREPETCVAAEVPVAGGKGTILFAQLDVQRHVDRSQPECDPVAERILVNLLQGMRGKGKP
jgi:hypothetical protein